MKSCVFLSDTINALSRSSKGGVARYFNNIVNGMIDRFRDRIIICTSELRDYGSARCFRSIRFRGSYTLKVHDVLASFAAYRTQPAVFFSPYYGDALTTAAQVFTVHDMTYELLPHYFPRDNFYIRRFIAEKRRCLERATALIAVSENTARDIITCYPHIDAKKIITIHHGVDNIFFANNTELKNIDQKPYFLYVGSRSLYKNFLRLLIAFGESGLARSFDLHVISPVGTDFSPQEKEYINKYHLQGSIHLRTAVNDDNLRASYQAAVALVYPSEYEGFGFPILEAMASGTLVATASTSSLPEVGGDVAFYFDPHSPESIADCLCQIGRLSLELRHQRIIQGVKRAKMFTWERCQQQTANVFQDLL